MEFLESLSILDIVIMILILVLSLFSAVKGLFKNIASFVLMLFAVLSASLLAQKLRDGYILSLIEDPGIAYVVSFLLVLFAAYLIIFGIMKVFMKNNKEKESLSNTLFALVIAMIKYAFLVAIGCSSLNSINAVKESQIWEESALVPTFVKVGNYAYNTKIKMQEVNLKDYVPKDATGGD